MQNIILNHTEIEHIIKRIAYQICECFEPEQTLVLAGIAENGFILAQRLAKALQEISDLQVLLCEVRMDKQNPEAAITTSVAAAQYAHRGLVLVDDVLNSGTTLIYAVRHFLQVPLVQFKTAVLVDRNHKKYPIKADFKGISLSTTLQEHVQVVFDSDGDYAYLTE